MLSPPYEYSSSPGQYESIDIKLHKHGTRITGTQVRVQYTTSMSRTIPSTAPIFYIFIFHRNDRLGPRLMNISSFCQVEFGCWAAQGFN